MLLYHDDSMFAARYDLGIVFGKLKLNDFADHASSWRCCGYLPVGS